MSARIKHPRKATASASYTDPAAFDALDSSEDEVGEPKRRRGGRVNKGKGRANADEDDELASDEDEDEPERKKRRTRRKGKGKAKGRKEKKDVLQTMPMDVLVEIFSYLHPGELLNLSYTSKAYRATLASKSAAPIWRRSRRRVALPDVDGLSELRYARLVFSKTCELCGGKAHLTTDYTLRVRFCRECRNDNYVKLPKLRKTHPHIHPRTADVVLFTKYSPAGWRQNSHYALQSDVDAYSDRLYELENEDDGDVELIRYKANLQSASRRSLRRSTFNDVAEFDGNSIPKTRVELYIAESAKVTQDLLEVGERLENAISRSYSVREQEQKRTKHEQARLRRVRQRQPVEHESDWTSDSGGPPYNTVQYELETRLRAEENIPYEVFYESAWRESKVVKLQKPFTDELYREVREKALGTLERAQASLQARQQRAEQQKKTAELSARRTDQIRQRYNGLRASEADPRARASSPLFPVFLTFESVQPLLPRKKPDDDYDGNLEETDWEDALPLIQEELAQYRLDLVLHAIKLILSATSDEDPPDDDEILDKLDQYDDAFFSRATSFLCCSVPGCFQYTKYHWPSYPRHEPADARITFIGSFHDVLEHQHAAHAVSDLKKLGRIGEDSKIYLDLPLEVACAVTALIELGALDEETAGKRELDRMSRKGRFEWENTRIHSKWFSSWQDLLDAVYRAAAKAAKAGPAHSLPPPCIVYRPRKGRASFSAFSSSDSDGDGGGGDSDGARMKIEELVEDESV
ncbi:hypothetical protein JCM6882_000153 [Rhodosporidiobolus microsporus]